MTDIVPEHQMKISDDLPGDSVGASTCEQPEQVTTDTVQEEHVPILETNTHEDVDDDELIIAKPRKVKKPHQLSDSEDEGDIFSAPSAVVDQSLNKPKLSDDEEIMEKQLNSDCSSSNSPPRSLIRKRVKTKSKWMSSNCDGSDDGIEIVL